MDSNFHNNDARKSSTAKVTEEYAYSLEYVHDSVLSDSVLSEDSNMLDSALSSAIRDSYRTREQYKLSRNAVKLLRKEKTRLKKLYRDYELLLKLAKHGKLNMLDLLKSNLIVVKQNAHRYTEHAELFNSNYAETETPEEKEKYRAEIW